MKTLFQIAAWFSIIPLLIILLILGVYLVVATAGIVLALISSIAVIILPAIIIGALAGLAVLMIAS